MTYDKDSLWVSFQDDICATMKAAKDFGFIEDEFNEIPASVLGELYPEAKDFGLTAFIVSFADDEANRLFKFASTLNPEDVAKTYLSETSGTGLVQEMEHLLKVRMQSIYNSLSSETITVVPGVEYAHDSVIDPANHETWAHSCKLLVELMANVYPYVKGVAQSKGLERPHGTILSYHYKHMMDALPRELRAQLTPFLLEY